LIPNIKDNLGRVPDVLTKVTLGTVPSVILNMLAVIDGGLGTVPKYQSQLLLGISKVTSVHQSCNLSEWPSSWHNREVQL